MVYKNITEYSWKVQICQSRCLCKYRCVCS